MDELRLTLFAASLSDFRIDCLQRLLEQGVDPNACLEPLLSPEQRNPDNPLCAWLLLASILFAEDDQFKPVWPKAWATLELLVDHGLDLTAPVSVAPHLREISRLDWLSRQHPRHAADMQARFARAQRSRMDQDTAPASQRLSLPPRL